MAPKTKPKAKPADRIKELETQLKRQQELHEVTKQIHSLSLDDIFLDTKDQVQALLMCERVTIYVKEPGKNEIFSKAMDGNELKEIRLNIDNKSLAGWVAKNHKGMRIRDAYDPNESQAIDPNLTFNPEWDKKTGFQTRQCISVPVMRNRRLFGVIQAINTEDGNPFNEIHEAQLHEIADSLAVSIHNKLRMRARTSKWDHLLANEFVTSETIEKATELAKKENFSPEYILIQNFQVPPEEVGKSLADFFRLDFVPYEPGAQPPLDITRLFAVEYLKHYLCVPLGKDGDEVIILMRNPKNFMLLDEIGKKIGCRVKPKVGIREDILNYINDFYGEKTVVDVDPDAMRDIVGDLEKEYAEREAKKKKKDDDDEVPTEEDRGIIALVNRIIKKAYSLGASDVHIEPYIDGELHVRFRVDGALIEEEPFPKKLWRAVVSRIKIMAGLDIAERRLPQDGKIRFGDYSDIPIELRVATIPTAGNHEDVVMRILAASKPYPLEKLGMQDHNLRWFKEVVEEPYGIILCVGPTGSGKTTTLHSALGFINKPDLKIWTAEDPVEITQKGLRQVNVQSKIGFGFERALRAFLRLDPDVIMIGEMRDAETAGAAVEASLTGHLVLSTLHTNNAPETITRLLDLDLDPFSFGDSLLCILAQRLVRTLCKCAKFDIASEEEWEKLRHEYGDNEGFYNMKFKREETKIGSAQGCSKCNDTGYKGRMGIHEILVVDDEIRSMVYRKAKSDEIRSQAVLKGMTMLKQDGIYKILKGHTDLNEVRSVCAR